MIVAEMTMQHLLGLIITGTCIGGFLLFGVFYFVARYDRDNSRVRDVWEAILFMAIIGVIGFFSLLPLAQ